MAKQKQNDQLEHTYSSYVRIRDVALKTSQKRWMIGRSGERGSGISVLVARHDDDDTYAAIQHNVTWSLIHGIMLSDQTPVLLLTQKHEKVDRMKIHKISSLSGHEQTTCLIGNKLCNGLTGHTSGHQCVTYGCGQEIFLTL